MSSDEILYDEPSYTFQNGNHQFLPDIPKKINNFYFKRNFVKSISRNLEITENYHHTIQWSISTRYFDQWFQSKKNFTYSSFDIFIFFTHRDKLFAEIYSIFRNRFTRFISTSPYFLKLNIAAIFSNIAYPDLPLPGVYYIY